MNTIAWFNGRQELAHLRPSTRRDNGEHQVYIGENLLASVAAYVTADDARAIGEAWCALADQLVIVDAEAAMS